MKTSASLFRLLMAWSLLCSSVMLSAQTYDFEPSAEHPFGLPHPDAPKELLDWAPLIGECDCKSIARNPDQSWGDTIQMLWRFKYIMNGMAVQDETLKADGKHSGSIRQFIADSSRWFVHYYSSGSPSTILPAWEGNRTEDGKIILYREQKAPNGMDGYYKITFSEISETGFNWLGEWVNLAETFSYPTWKIYCQKKQSMTWETEKQKIMANVRAFSQAYMDGDYEAMTNAYTLDGKIFPNNARIIEGHEAIKKRWTITDGSKVLLHEIQPEEIKFIGNYAYDYGYYHGKTQRPDGSVVTWKGKYVVVWKKVAGVWKMYIDIWNRVKD